MTPRESGSILDISMVCVITKLQLVKICETRKPILNCQQPASVVYKVMRDPPAITIKSVITSNLAQLNFFVRYPTINKDGKLKIVFIIFIVA